MKILTLNLALIFSATLLLTSCDYSISTFPNEARIHMEFADGTVISQNDIMFYDSASHLYFLYNPIEFDFLPESFSIRVDQDTILTGIGFSCAISRPPPVSFYITDCFQYTTRILDIAYYPYSTDLRNDERVIHALKNGAKLRHGISCRIDKVEVTKLDSSSAVNCMITIRNNDQVDYYIPDREKMDELKFNYYMGGIYFRNSETGLSSFLRWTQPCPNWTSISMDELRLLPGKSEVSFNFSSTDYYTMPSGSYEAKFRFYGLKYDIDDFDLNQKDGRIWIGESISTKSVLVE